MPLTGKKNYYAKQTVTISYKKTRSISCLFGPPLRIVYLLKSTFYFLKIPHWLQNMSTFQYVSATCLYFGTNEGIFVK